MNNIHSIREGSGPLVVLSHALGCDLHMYDALAADLAPDFTVIRYDHRSHGKSFVVKGEDAIEHFGDDAAAVIRREARGEPVIFAGTSLGGMTAQSLAARHPELVRGLVIANSAMVYDQAARALWPARVELVRNHGMAALVDGAMERWFSADFRQRRPDVIAAARQTLLACDVDGYAASCVAIAAIDFTSSNVRVNCPTLVIDGSHDIATPAAMSDAIANCIKRARRATLATGHLGATEDPQGFARLVREFASSL